MEKVVYVLLQKDELVHLRGRALALRSGLLLPIFLIRRQLTRVERHDSPQPPALAGGLFQCRLHRKTHS